MTTDTKLHTDPSYVDAAWPTADELYAAKIARRVADLRSPAPREQHWNVIPGQEVGDTLVALVNAVDSTETYRAAVQVFVDLRATRARLWAEACVLSLMVAGRGYASAEDRRIDRQAVLGLL